jgi:hypothetical protein
MSVAIPKFLSHLSVWQGKPVPFTIQYFDGVPDFRVVDHEKKRICLMERICAICGRALGEYGWFIGGPKSLVENSLFSDPAQHEHCARYAIQACPFLNGTITKSTAEIRPVHGSVIEPLVSADRSAQIGMRRAKEWMPVNQEGYALIQVTRWHGRAIWLA